MHLSATLPPAPQAWDAVRRPPFFRTMLVFAHPDDETVGMGASLCRLGPAWFVCVTDGSPPDPADAQRAGCASRVAYAQLRREELRAAVQSAGHDSARISMFGIGDQEATFRLAGITHALDVLLDAIRPRLVVTHPYEGGHPDHDAPAFAVQAALALRRARGAAVPSLAEMTSYHNCAGALEFGTFLAGTGAPAITLALDEAARARKRRLFACHASQAELLHTVPLECERFRRAPTYDFTQPPHAGTLLYEQFPWGVTGAHWRRLAGAVLDQLGLRSMPTTAEERAPCA